MFNKNLKYYRLQKNMSKKELADKCGVSAMAITHYENGDRKPDIDMIKKLAEALGVFVADFLAERNTSLSFVHGEFRKQASLSESKQEYIRESVEEYFSRFFDAVECLGGNPLPEPPKTESIKWDADVERCTSVRSYHRGESTCICGFNGNCLGCFPAIKFYPLASLEYIYFR